MRCGATLMSNDASDIRVRIMGHDDRAEWLALRVLLWPDARAQEHANWIADMLDDHDTWAFIAETTNGSIAGFAEVTVRKFANGCETQPVPFLEGIWVRDGFRRQKVGARMIQHIEAIFAGLGYREIGSDVLLENLESQAAHVAWGFSETERVVYYRKDLKV
jgi:aminoglycoside 6'-N-acetyltransferase I